MNEREYYRVRLPVGERPRLLIGKSRYEILDFSEEGLCIFAPALRLSLNERVAGVVRFLDGEEFEVAGRVVRVGRGKAGLLLDRQGIPFRKVVDEQRRLLSTYPQLRDTWRT